MMSQLLVEVGCCGGCCVLGRVVEGGGGCCCLHGVNGEVLSAHQHLTAAHHRTDHITSHHTTGKEEHVLRTVPPSFEEEEKPHNVL